MAAPGDWLNRKRISTTDVNSPTHSHGRTPWYGPKSPSKRCKRTFLIGVAGGTASGKTSVCRAVVDHLQLPWVQILSQDCFYRPLTAAERADVANYNFDHPRAFDWELLLSVLRELKQGKAVKCPQYDFNTHSRKKEHTLMYGADVVLCEGILMLHQPEILAQFDVKVFVKTDDDIRLIRRIKRDIAERGRDLDGVLAQYQKTVKPSYQLFCEPTAQLADIVIPNGRENTVGIELLCNHIQSKLIEGGNVNPIFYTKDAIALNKSVNSVRDLLLLPDNVLRPDDANKDIAAAVEQLHSPELHGEKLLNTIAALCHGLLSLCLAEFIPRSFFTPSPVPTPPAFPDMNAHVDDPVDTASSDTPPTPEVIVFDDADDVDGVGDIEAELCHPDGKEPDGDDDGHSWGVCVVTIFSGGMLFGETIMEQLSGKEQAFNGAVQFGSIHIFHESKKPAKPRFYDRKLPPNISEQKVIMVDAFIGTGNRARMALQVLVDHHVPQQNICFITLESSTEGIVHLARVFPNVLFITARVGHIGHQEQHWEMVPETSSLVIKYCKAAGIDVVEQETINGQ